VDCRPAHRQDNDEDRNPGCQTNQQNSGQTHRVTKTSRHLGAPRFARNDHGQTIEIMRFAG